MNGGVARKDALHTLEGQLLNRILEFIFPRGVALDEAIRVV